MEYLIGSIVTFVLLVTFVRLIQVKESKKIFSPLYSQSMVFEITKGYLVASLEFIPEKTTQSSKYLAETTIRILFIGDKAYWIANNTLYQADANNGEINQDSAIQVDTMGMDDVELNKTMLIVEKLREGFNNETWYPGDTQF